MVIMNIEAKDELCPSVHNIILQAIKRLATRKTILMIAHRLTTLRGADLIYVFDHGKIISSGTYNELIESCDKFRNLSALKPSHESHISYYYNKRVQ